MNRRPARRSEQESGRRRIGVFRPTLAFLVVAACATTLFATIVVRDPGGLSAETAALILSGQQGGDLAMEAVAVPLAWANDVVTVGVFVELAGQDLLGDQQEELLRVEFLVYAIEGQASVRSYVIQAFELALDQYGEALAAGGLRFSGQLELPPGEYSLAILASSPKEFAQGMGLRRIELSLPPADSSNALLQPRLASPESAWINAFQVLAAAEGHAELQERLARAARSVAAKPVLAADGQAEVIVPALGAARAAKAYVIEFLDGGGEVVLESELVAHEPTREPLGESALEEPGAATTSRSWVQGTVDLTGLAAGAYFLRSAIRPADGEAFHSPSLPVIVASAAIAGGAPSPATWAAASDRRAAPAAAAGVDMPRPGKRTKLKAKDVEELEAGYASILGTAAAEASGVFRGDPGAEAARALAAFELQAVADYGDRGLPSLAAAEMRLIRAVGKRSAAALIPIARLHQMAYREHRSRRAFLLATHARNLALAVVELYIDGGAAEESARQEALREKPDRLPIAARLLASFGGDLQQAGLRRLSERLFLRALECDDENEAALMGMGASFEKYSEFAGAAGYFERLVEARSESGEGRLRLAVNLNRLGRKAKAIEQFQRLLEGDYQRWVQVLAAQELARMHIVAGDLQPAEALLERAIERFPDEPKFYFQRAFLANAAGAPWRARSELDRMSRVPALDGDSPRYAYSNWPAGAFERVWALSNGDVSSRLEALAAALPEAPGSAGR